MKDVTGIKEIIKPENLVYKRSSVLTDNVFSYCPAVGMVQLIVSWLKSLKKQGCNLKQ